MSLPLPSLYTPAQVAREYRVSKATVYNAIRSGRLRAVRLTDHRLRLSREAVRRWIREMEMETN